MSLRQKIQLIVGLLTLAFVAGLVGVQYAAMRDSVREEVVAANRVATQILRRLSALYAMQGTPGMLAFLQGLGRVRSNDLALFDGSGTLLYRSPASPYKAGRDAPDWFQSLIAPPAEHQVLEFPDGRLEVRTEASRAALDAWDTLSASAAVALAALVAVHALVFWGVGRTVRPFARIVQGLAELEAGRFDARLPPLPGREAGAIGAAFNRMAQALAGHIETERRAVRAEAQLGEQRELSRWVSQRIEDERRMIARELHDEFGQSVTAMRSMALSIAQRLQPQDPASADAARLIADESSRLYDAMHGLIPRLAPLVLDRFGLAEALQELAERTRRAHQGVTLVLELALPEGLELSADAALALYRAAQEGITNALRHGGAGRLTLAATAGAGQVRLELVDDGSGLPEGWRDRPGHHGLRWLAERAEALHGQLVVERGAGGRGTRLLMQVPGAAAEASA